ncbi:hypothetical protein LOD99_14687 [Oopsacas minuta]|uniref:V(D)J recombination-activating protein 1 RNase H domain-containing protein n=1 Tax=Oopsacas minuta TaxID=111878 RepID=A0AAV7KD92_9METZ|nr:hypothetical protein LOD99_14687 [Oopsacas minuta]
MTEELTFPKSRLELARILKDNNNCVLKTTKYFKEHFEIDSDNTKLLETLLLRIRDRFKKAKRSLDCLEGEWWHSNISMKPELKKNRDSDLLESSSDDGEVPIHSVSHRKHLDDLSLQQQRIRLSSLLECIKSLSVIENTTEISIAALSLQLLANEENNRQVATVAKEIIVSGGFCNLSNKHVPVDKALFLLDLLEVGRRKYTQLRQTLLPDNIHFPSYSKLANLRDVMISGSSITLYPNPAKPIGIHAPYFLQVQKTLERILSMVDRPTSEEFPLTFKIADGLDGSGCHTIYNQQTTNTFTKNFIPFRFKPISIHTVTNRIVWQNKSPNSPFSQRPIFLCAATECEENIRSFMETMINPDTAMLQNGIPLEMVLSMSILSAQCLTGRWQPFSLELEEPVVRCALPHIKI